MADQLLIGNGEGNGEFGGCHFTVRKWRWARALTEIFGRRRVPKISEGLSIFIYYELWVGRWIPGDGPVLPRPLS